MGVDVWGLRIFASRESRSPELPAADKFELEGVSFGAKKEAREFGSASSSELERFKVVKAFSCLPARRVGHNLSRLSDRHHDRNRQLRRALW